MKKDEMQHFTDEGELLYFVLPCPFCSSTDVEIRFYIDRFKNTMYYVHCLECNSEGGKGKETAGYIGKFWNDPAVQRAVDKWNARGNKAKSDDYKLI